MTASRDLKKLIRKRMHKTGESYTAARRHFLHPKEATMTTRTVQTQPPGLDLSVDDLQLTLRTVLVLKQHDIRTIGDLARKADGELAALGLAAQSRIEIREVLASRGVQQPATEASA